MYVAFKIPSRPPQTLLLLKDRLSLEYYEGINDREVLVVTHVEAPALEEFLQEHELEYTRFEIAELPDPMRILDFLELAAHPDFIDPSDN